MRIKSLFIIGIFFPIAIFRCGYSNDAFIPPIENTNKTVDISATPETLIALTSTKSATPKPLAPNPTSTNTQYVTTTSVELPNILVAYSTSDYKLFILRGLTLPAIKVADDIFASSIYISDDGKSIVYWVDQGRTYNPSIPSSLRMVNSDGSDDHAIITQEQIMTLRKNENKPIATLDFQKMKWIPGTRRLLFNTALGLPIGQQPLDDLYEIDIDTGTIRSIFPVGLGGYAWPSPDGKILGITDSYSTFLASISGTIIKKDIILFSNYNNWEPEVVWKSDSSRFGVIIPSKYMNKLIIEGSINNYYTTILSIDSSTGQVMVVGTIDNYDHGKLSNTLDYVGYSETSFGMTHLASVDGSTSRLLTSEPSGFISFSPDGSHFAYYVGNPSQYHKPCFDTQAETEIYIGSISGESISLAEKTDPSLFRWINNFQFIYSTGRTLQVGDVNGNSTPIDTATACISEFEAVDLSLRDL